MLNDVGLKHIGYATDYKRIWYVTETNYLLMEIHIQKQTIKCLCMVPGLSGKSEEYRVLGYYENKLYVLPFRSRYMYIYDLAEGKGIHVPIRQDQDVCATGCIYRDGYMYIYGWNGYLIKYCISDQTYCYLDLDTQILGMNYVPEKWFWTDAFLQKNEIYLPMAMDKGAVVIGENDQISYINLGEDQKRWQLRNILNDNEKIHVIYEDENKHIHATTYDYGGNLLEDADVLLHRDFEVYPYGRAYLCGRKWVLFPYKSPWLCCVDESGGDVVDMEILGEKVGESPPGLYTAVIGLNDGWIYAIDQSTGDALSVNANTLETRRIKLSLLPPPRNYLAELYHTNSAMLVSEMKGFAELKDFIDMLVEEK